MKPQFWKFVSVPKVTEKDLSEFMRQERTAWTPSGQNMGPEKQKNNNQAFSLTYNWIVILFKVF